MTSYLENKSAPVTAPEIPGPLCFSERIAIHPLSGTRWTQNHFVRVLILINSEKVFFVFLLIILYCMLFSGFLTSSVLCRTEHGSYGPSHNVFSGLNPNSERRIVILKYRMNFSAQSHLICPWRPSERREKSSPTCKAQMNHPFPYPIII